MTETPDSSRVKGFFSISAPFYDFFVGRLMGKNAQRGMEFLSPVEGLTALDICTGTGIMAKALFEEGAKVTGIDFTPAMLDRARRKLEDTDVELKLMDAGKLDFPDKSFDIVTVSMGLHDIPGNYRKEVLKEMGRVCRGHILIIDNCGVPENKLNRKMTSMLERMEGSNYRDFVEENIEQMLGKAGIFITENKVIKNTCYLLCKSKN